MRARPPLRTALLLLAGLLLALQPRLPAAQSLGSIEIVVNSDHASVQMDRSMLRSLFMMRVRQWSDGATVHVFVLPDGSDVHDQFCRDQLGTYPYVLRSAWDRIVFTGTGLAPTTVSTQEELIARVRATPGAIGYIRRRADVPVNFQGGTRP